MWLLNCAGYAQHFRSLSEFLSAKFGDAIEMVGQEDEAITGNFEVTAGQQLIHSRPDKQQCQGSLAATPQERSYIVAAIETLLEDADE